MTTYKRIKVGRNDPCPCGSRKKFKKCCLIAQDAWRLKPIIEREFSEKQIARSDKFGWVRPIIHQDFKGNKFVAVGNKLHYSKDWKTVPDFLLMKK